MQNLCWWVVVPQSEDRKSITSRVLNDFCDSLNLCLGLGCACATGVDEHGKCCSETELDGPFPMHYSQGPNWSLCVLELTTSIKIDFYYAGPMLTNELGELWNRIQGYGYGVIPQGRSLIP